MSYLPSKLPETETEPRFTPNMLGLLAWLETMPPETEYAWYDTSACLCCRFAQARGIPAPWVSPAGHYSEIFPSVDVYYRVGHTEPWTYGVALLRLRAVLREDI